MTINAAHEPNTDDPRTQEVFNEEDQALLDALGIGDTTLDDALSLLGQGMSQISAVLKEGTLYE